jgi:mono/diheme cytochrome c family protein
MKRRRLIQVGVLVLLASAAYAGWSMMRRGFSARDTPSLLETYIARAARRFAIPAAARYEKNPFSPTPEIIAEARAHFADHCATCHANDGSGQTQIGRNLYPKAPDMRLPATQNLTDGEIYSIIHNGIRLTGMPAWGDSTGDEDSWKLVLFIRHLPTMTSEEMKEMGRLNPKSDAEREEEKQEEEFLRGGNPPAKAGKHHP